MIRSFRLPFRARTSPAASIALSLEALEQREVPATFDVTNLDDSGAGSLRDAVGDANASAGADVVTFDAGLSGTIVLTSGEIEIYDGPIEIQGLGASVLTVDADDDSRIFRVYDESDTVISGLTLTGGNTGGDGGAILSNSSLTLIDTIVTDNRAGENGGGIALEPAFYFGNASAGERATASSRGQVTQNAASGTIAVTLQDSQVTFNAADGEGGGIFAAGRNFYYGEGGDFYALVNVNVQRSEVSFNAAGRNGGGIFGYQVADFSVEDSLISGNSCDGAGGEEVEYGGGGGIFLYRAEFAAIRNCQVTGNSTGRSGGGVYLYGNSETFVIENSTIADNVAGINGGGFALGDDDVEEGDLAFRITASTISGNIAGERGGGIDAARQCLDSFMVIENSTISGNESPDGAGGGIYLSPGDPGSVIRNSTIVGNAGGGVRFVAQYFKYYDGSIVENDLTIVSSIVHGNAGDDVSSDGGTIVAENNLFGVAPTGVVFAGNLANLVGVDPLLGALADNGGPTLTHLPQFGSPVFDVGSNPAGLQTDQRGEPRLLGNGVDIGAVESEPKFPVDPPPGPGPEPETEGDELPPFWVASGAPAGVGLPNPADDADQAFVRSLYRGILGREVDAAGFESWVNDLRSGASREDVVNGFLRSREYRLRAVENMFQVFLERSASEVELALYVAALDDGSSLEDLAADILASDEYALAHPTSADFVAGLYEDILLREPDAGADAYVAQLDSGGISRLDLATVFVKSGDSSTVEFFNISLRYFGTFPDGLPPSGDALDLAFVLLT
ncbi:MAG TPA: DUF4214 domain-containing protein [Planctomycetia bacterium]|nr:DUF4214 domain-containing protein [Planctomycetia bacterium]